MTHFDPITLVVALALLSLVPLAAVMMTSFLKIAIVLSLVRNALGVQQ
ncbi:MAG TPA: EscR/YscR/HrcR family type III secretion system export apparatus protein, partial [Bordetella sp.]